ncbi:hypothetical protein [Pandoraea apista]|uniref:hypothetical protein n=1 Tax=Pandoraea apista TaxID=93218 RepID=UPI00058A909F|nr:hypothetical protein [Pandoraea apista]AJE97256.1 hypothetical protein SG18_02080 [Pandoraea apista]AKH71221.1 hypothetical protein XM39_02080 [Pandoraea apista]AKI63493.1 hypothetical protein AA956_19400 [Pandoraea apista]
MTRIAKMVRAFTGAKRFWNESPDAEKHRIVRILVGVALLVAGGVTWFVWHSVWLATGFMVVAGILSAPLLDDLTEKRQENREGRLDLINMLPHASNSGIPMRKRTVARKIVITMTSGITLLLTACGTVVKPSDMKRPDVISCIEVPTGVESHTTHGLFSSHWTTRLAPGAYVSEREDAKGTYYRGPYEAITTSVEGVNRPPTATDGGIWVPRDDRQFPVVYEYFAWKDPQTAPPKGAHCADATIVLAPGTASAGRIIFSANEIAGRDTNGVLTTQPADAALEVGLQAGTNGALTGGQVTGAGIAGGVVGGIIIGALIQMDVGKITHAPYRSDDNLASTLMDLRHSAKPIQVVPPPAENVPLPGSQ